MMFPPKLLSHRPILCGLFSLFLLCFSICSLISEASSPLQNFSPISQISHPIHPHPSPSLKLHPHPFIDSPSPIHLNRFTLTHSPSPSHILKGFWVWVKILQKRNSVDVGGFSSVGVSANCKVGFDQCIRVFVFVFLFSLCKKKRDSACVCVWVLIKELLLMFAEVMVFF